jgi:hypothetical protein
MKCNDAENGIIVWFDLVMFGHSSHVVGQKSLVKKEV